METGDKSSARTEKISVESTVMTAGSLYITERSSEKPSAHISTRTGLPAFLAKRAARPAMAEKSVMTDPCGMNEADRISGRAGVRWMIARLAGAARAVRSMMTAAMTGGIREEWKNRDSMPVSAAWMMTKAEDLTRVREKNSG